MGVIRGLTIETTRTPNPGVTRRRLGYAIVASAVFAGCSVDRARLPLGSQGQTMSDIDHGASAAAVDAMDMMGADALPDTELHLQLSPGRPATADDSTRADMILVDARAALRKYVDVRVAAADGFEELPAAAGKHALHHLTNWAWAAAEGRRFDAIGRRDVYGSRFGIHRGIGSADPGEPCPLAPARQLVHPARRHRIAMAGDA